MLNINKGRNKELMSKCRVLWEYTEFVSRVRENYELLKDFRIAVDNAVNSCIHDGILEEYLISHKSEVDEMCITEYNETETLKILTKEVREESYAEGVADGVAQGVAQGIAQGVAQGERNQQQKTIRRMKEEGMPIGLIAKIMDVTEEYVNTVL